MTKIEWGQESTVPAADWITDKVQSPRCHSRPRCGEKTCRHGENAPLAARGRWDTLIDYAHLQINATRSQTNKSTHWCKILFFFQTIHLHWMTHRSEVRGLLVCCMNKVRRRNREFLRIQGGCRGETPSVIRDIESSLSTRPPPFGFSLPTFHPLGWFVAD